jgi:hypothetical protein
MVWHDDCMKGVLTVDQQIAILGKIWGNDREGFVFLPWIDGKANDKKARRAGYHEGPAFDWPKDRDRIKEWLTQHPNDDVYFAPCLFEDKRRIEQAAAPERTLWADLDEVDPREIDESLRPTIAWESSPGRFQGVWLLDRPKIGLSWAGDINHRLTMALGADASGWDTTQLLRVPGRPNHKFDYRSSPNESVPGQLLWDNGRRYFIDDDFDDLPEVGVVDVGGDLDLMDASVIGQVDRHEVWGRVRLKMPKAIREYMAIRTGAQADDIGKDQPEGRSGIQWQIMMELARAGCTVAEIVAVVQHTVWNTFRGRSDELKRLKIGAAKAKSKVDDHDDSDDGEAFEEIGPDKPTIAWLSDIMAVPMGRPRWLVRNVWSENGCGFIAGDPKSYKSWTALDLAVTVATGGNFLNDPAMHAMRGPLPFLYLQEEDSEIVVRDRLENVVEGKCPHLHWNGRISRDVSGAVWWSPADGNIPLGFHVRAGFVASDIGWQQWLMDMLSEHEFAGVVIDTLGTTAGEVDTDRAQDLMTKILRPMRQISHDTHTAIAVVHHNRKGSNGGTERGGARMLGSVALHAWVDDAMYLHSRESKAGGVTKLRVERESKSAMEHRFTLEVPTMGINRNGTRTFWEPVVGLWDASEGTAVTGDSDVPETKVPVHRGRVPGGSIALRVKSRGGTGPHHPVTLADICEITHLTPAKAWAQMQSAMANGLLAGDKETGVWVINP